MSAKCFSNSSSMLLFRIKKMSGNLSFLYYMPMALSHGAWDLSLSLYLGRYNVVEGFSDSRFCRNIWALAVSFIGFHISTGLNFYLGFLGCLVFYASALKMGIGVWIKWWLIAEIRWTQLSKFTTFLIMLMNFLYHGVFYQSTV